MAWPAPWLARDNSARDEIASAYWLLSRPRVVHGLRTRLMRNARLPRRALNELYLPASEIRQVNRDQVRQLRQQREREQAPSELESRELAFTCPPSSTSL